MPARITKATTLALYSAVGDVRVTKAALLVLARTAQPVYVTKAAVLVLTSGSCITKLCQCWKIVRRDGISFHYTTHNEPVTFMGATYTPCNSISASAFESGIVNGNSFGDVDITGILSADGITEHDLAHGLFDGAAVTVYRVPWEYEQGSGASGRLIAEGVIDTSTQGDAQYTATIKTKAAKLRETPIVELYSPACRYELGQGLCPVNLSSYEHVGTVTNEIAPQPLYRNNYRQFVDSTISESDEYYQGGKLTWTSGDNSGISSEIKNYTASSNLINLWRIMPNPIKQGDEYVMTPGCDKTRNDHENKFGLNVESFGGQPDLPGNDAIRRTPNIRTRPG